MSAMTLFVDLFEQPYKPIHLDYISKKYILRHYRGDVSNMITTVIQKWGNSQGIRLPKKLLATLNWNINDKVSIVTKDDKLIIEQVHSRYVSSEIDWGEPVGKEIL